MGPDDRFVLEAVGMSGRQALARDAAGEGTALVVDVSPNEMLDVWTTARSAVDRTGRWPVLCSRHEAHDGSLFSRFYFDEGSHGAGSGPAQRYGAGPVAAFEVTTWLTVARPPTDPDDAWQLAFEHYTLAANTLVTTGVSVRHHARLLSHLDRWVLFSRP